MKNKIKEVLISIIFPTHCPFCDTVIDSKSLCCDSCAKKLPLTSPYSVCRRCGKGECICKRKPFLERLYVPFFYRGIVRDSIRNLKFHDKRAYSRTLARILSEFILKDDRYEGFDLIIPVPMTKKDVSLRGYNQSKLIAKFLSKSLNVKLDCTSLLKIKQTEKQHDLKAKERSLNLKGSFEVVNPSNIKGKSLLICDDVITTGATLKEVSAVLTKAGARSISAVVIATTSDVEKY